MLLKADINYVTILGQKYWHSTTIISSGEIIETYPDDESCPSVLIMGLIEAIVYHTVIAVCTDHIRVIIVYIPEENKWIEYRKRRTEP